MKQSNRSESNATRSEAELSYQNLNFDHKLGALPPIPPKGEFPYTSCFLLSSSAKSLNDEFQNYNDFGLTSHLTSCSTNLSIYNTYVANSSFCCSGGEVEDTLREAPNCHSKASPSGAELSNTSCSDAQRSKVESCGLKATLPKYPLGGVPNTKCSKVEPSSFTVKLLSHLEETQTLTDSTGLINSNYHA